MRVEFEAFHVDSPLAYNQWPTPKEGYAKLDALMPHVRSKGLRSGKYFNDATGGHTSGAAFEHGSVQDATEFVRANGAPDHAIAESWYSFPRVALPETVPGSMGHTALAVTKAVGNSAQER